MGPQNGLADSRLHGLRVVLGLICPCVLGLALRPNPSQVALQQPRRVGQVARWCA